MPKLFVKGHKPWNKGKGFPEEIKKQRRALSLKKYSLTDKGKAVSKKAAKKWREKNKIIVKKRNKGYRLKSKYSLSMENYNQLFLNQQGQCAICGQTDLKGLNVDHNHKTTKVRGLLCSKCNLGLGQFKDSKDLLLEAVNYLSRYEY